MASRARSNAGHRQPFSGWRTPLWSASKRKRRKGRYLTTFDTRTKGNRTRANRADRRKVHQALRP